MAPLAQFDMWTGRGDYPDDAVMRPDEHGDVLMYGATWEPHRAGTTVRVHVDPDAAEDDVVRCLRRLTDHLDGYWDELRQTSNGDPRRPAPSPPF